MQGDSSLEDHQVEQACLWWAIGSCKHVVLMEPSFILAAEVGIFYVML